MSLNIITGKDGSLKQEYLMKKIMACNKYAILFVPSFYRVTAELDYLKYTNSKAVIDKEITSIARYVDKNLDKDKLYEDKKYLPDLAKKMLVRKVIKENEELLDIFKKVKGNTNFIDTICGYIDSAKSNLITPNDILKAYDEEDFLGKKLKELGNIYEKVEDTLQERFVSAKDELAFYTNNLVEDGNKEYFFYLYNNFNKLELEYITKLLTSGASVTISLDLDKEMYNVEEGGVYSISYNTYEALEDICNLNGIKFEETKFTKEDTDVKEDIKYLTDNIFSMTAKKYDKASLNISCILKENTYEEIRYVAEYIIKEVRKGMRYKDIAVYTNEMDKYLLGIKKIFAMYNIPIYINETKDLVSNTLVIYLLNMLNLVCFGFKKDITCIIDILKTGLLDIDIDDVYLFEKYVVEYGIKGYMLDTPFKQNKSCEYDLDKLNNVREKVLDYKEDLYEKLKDKNLSLDITSGIYEHLQSKDIINMYSKLLESIKQESENEFSRKKQVVSKVYEVMDNICIAYDKLELSEYIELFEYGTKEVTTDTIPEKLDQVYIADINKSRGTDKRLGFVIGMYDGGLPKIQTEDSIFTDKELNTLKERNVILKETSENRNNMQLFNILAVIKKVKEKLVFTAPSSNMTGGSLRVGILMQNIKNLMNLKLENVQEESVNKDVSFTELLNNILNNTEFSVEELKEAYVKYLMYEQDERYSKIINYVRSDKNLNKDTIDKVYKDNIMSSVSRLEKFKRCPFDYYLEYVLKIKENKKYEMTNMDTGSLMHEVLEKFSKYIVSKNIDWQDIILNENIQEEVKIKIFEIVDKIFEEEYGAYLKTARYVVLKNKLKKGMVKIVFAIAESFNHSEFRPLGYEISFENGELFTPIKVELEDKTLYLRGKIDRVDSMNIDGDTYIRIVDYKSSNKDLKLSDVKDKISLQLMTYMWAMMENKEKINDKGKVIPTAINYFTISNRLLNIPSYEQDENKITEKLIENLKLRGIYLKDIEVLKKLDNNFEDGKKSYIEVNKNNINSKKDKVLPEDVFIEECNNMKRILKDIGTDIVKGTVSITPNSKIKGVCDYCKFHSVCRKNIVN